MRKVVEVSGAELDAPFGGRSLGQTLLAPTRIYVKPILALLQQVDVHAIAHITGGGLPENLPRVMSAKYLAVIDHSRWQRPTIFDWLQEQGRIGDREMYRTFNCGIGMVVCVGADQAERALTELHQAGEDAMIIGAIERSEHEEARVEIR